MCVLISPKKILLKIITYTQKEKNKVFYKNSYFTIPLAIILMKTNYTILKIAYKFLPITTDSCVNANKPCFRADTATTEGVCMWIIHLISGLAEWTAPWSEKAVIFTGKFVVPCSNTFPCMSVFIKLEAVISWKSMPYGLTRNCSSSWFNL